MSGDIIELNQADSNKLGVTDWYFLLASYGDVLAIIALITVIAAWLLIQVKTNIIIKLIVIPLIFYMYYVILDRASEVLGYAFPSIPHGKVLYLSAERSDDVIELWVKHLDDKYSRLYKIPYSTNVENKLEKARKGTEGGHSYILEWKEGGNEGAAYNEDDLVVTDMIDLYNLTKEDYDNEND
jgi:hypothetical protein